MDGTPQRSRLPSGSNFRATVVEHDHVVAARNRRSERDDVTVTPHLGTQGLTGVHRSREAHGETDQPARVMTTCRLDDGAPGNRIGTEAVQDRLTESRGTRDVWIPVDEVE